MTDSFTLKEMLIEVREQQKNHDNKLDAIHEQALKTNGRVNRLEESSIGLWVKKNPRAAALTLVGFIMILVAETRGLVWEGIKVIIGL